MSQRSYTPTKTLNISNINSPLKVAITNHKLDDGFVKYTIKLIDEAINDIWSFESRFSEISALNNAILNSKKIPISDLPKFPKKKLLWTNNKDPQMIIKRRKKLERFLSHIFSNDKILALECVQDFIVRYHQQAFY